LASFIFFFFSSRRRHTRSLRDWSSDVCSSDLSYCRWVMAQRQYEYSQKLMLRALAVDPNYPAALNELGYTYARLGDYENALPARSEERRVGKECRCGW